MIPTLLTILGYAIMGAFLYFVLEPWLRLRKNILLAKDEIDRDAIRVMGSIFWPAAFVFYPLLRFVIFPFFKFLGKLSDRADNYWKTPPTKSVEPKINEAKSDYRKVEYYHLGVKESENYYL